MKVRRPAGVALVAAAVLLLGSLGAQAQTAHYEGTVTGLFVPLSAPYGVAVDSSGNLFVADNGSVREILAGTGGALPGKISAFPMVNTVGPQFPSTYGVAIDASGNVYVTSATSVTEIEAVGGVVPPIPTVVTLGSSFNSPFGVAVDPGGDVFVADTLNNALKEFVAGTGGAPAGQVSATSTLLTLSNVTFSPGGVAIDANGNVFLTDRLSQSVWEIAAGTGGAPGGQVSSTSTITKVATGFTSVSGVAVDASGDLFVADAYADANWVTEIVAVGGQVSLTSPVIVRDGNSGPFGVAVNAVGDIYASYPGYPLVAKFEPAATDFGIIKVGNTSIRSYIPFKFDSAGTPSGWSVETQGGQLPDYTEVTTGGGTVTTCSKTTDYAIGGSCIVAVQFSPKLPGQRLGAVQMFDSNGNVIATANLTGVGTAPQVVFPSNNTPVAVGSGFSAPGGVAVDARGNVFIADTGNSAVEEIAPPGWTVKPVGSGFSSPRGVAVDGSGDVFVADTGNSAIKEILAVKGVVSSASPVITVGSGFNKPYGVAVDARGNVFVADTFNSAIEEIVAVDGQVSSSSAVITLAIISTPNFSYPCGVAVDASGDVFFADTNNKAVREILAVNGQVSALSAVISVGSGFSFTYNVSNDAAGNVFVADNGNNAVKEIVAVNGQVSPSSMVIALGSLFKAPSGVAVDQSGNVFVADTTNNAVKEMALAIPPSLNFATTAVGSTSIDSPQTVQIQNDGNAALTFTALSYPTDFPYAGSGTNPCTATTSLNPGFECDLDIDFSPLSAGSPLSEYVTPTDNALNATGERQLIAVSGTTALTAQVTANAISPTVGTAFSGQVATFIAGADSLPTGDFTATINWGDSTISAGVISQPGGPGTSYVVDASHTYASAGPFPLQVAVSLNGGTPATGTNTATVSQASTTTSVVVDDPNLSGPWNGAETAGAMANGAAMVSLGGPGSPTGTVTYALYNTSGCSSGTIGTSTVPVSSTFVPISLPFGPLGAGVYSLSATYSGDSNYLGSSSTCAPFFVLQDFPTMSVASSLNPSISGQPVLLTATILGGYMPSGNVGFTSNGTPISGCAVEPVLSGTAQCLTTSLPAGNDAIAVMYSGDANNNATPGSLVGGQQVTVLNLVVNTMGDSDATPANCSAQPTPGSSPNPDACALRDALLESASVGSANISFDSTVFNAPTTITLGSALSIPTLTTITGPTSGSGYTLKNLVTVSAGTNNFKPITVNSGVTGAAIANLIIGNSATTNSRGEIANQGSLTVTQCAFPATGASSETAITNSGVMVLAYSTVSGHSNGEGAAALGAGINNSGTMTITAVTIEGNGAEGNSISGNGQGYGGGIYNTGHMTVTNSTITGNLAEGDVGANGGGIYNSASLTINNSIVAGNSASTNYGGPASPNIDGTYSGTGNLIGGTVTLATLGNYGGPTQTMIPLPGSTAICAGLPANLVGSTDQRGFPNSNANYTGYTPPDAACVDAGAVQTNYDIEFTQQPPAAVGPGAAIIPSPALAVTESAIGVNGVTVSMAATEGTLSGTTSVSSSAGTVTFNGLSIATAVTGDTLTATLVLNPALSIVRTSGSFNVENPLPALTTPQPGTTLTCADLSNCTVTFTWTPGLGSTLYLLTIGTTTQGSTDVYYGPTVPYTTTSAQVPNIPAYGQTLFVRLHYYQNGVWSYIDYNYTEAGSPAAPALTTPQPGTTLSCADLSNCTVTFAWTPGGGSSFYRLRLGTTHPGSYDVYNGAEVRYPATSVQVSNIPATGGTLYARFYYYQNGAWPYIDYTYTEAGAPAPPALTTPATGTALTCADLSNCTVTFAWTPGMGSTQFRLALGTTGHGSTNVYYGGVVPSTTTSVQVSNIPANAQTLFARLYYYGNGAWSYIDYTYTEAGTQAPPALTTPQPGTTLSNTNPLTFTWTPGLGSTLFRLTLGTTGHGSTDVYNGAEAPNTTTSAQVSNIPPNAQPLYARLRYYINGAWSYVDYMYTEPGTQVLPALTTPTPGTTLICTGSPGCTVTFGWDPGLGSTQFRLRLGTKYPGSYNVYDSNPVPNTTTSVPVSNIPTTGATIYARFYYYLNGAWSYLDYIYTEQ